jgi:cysteinyl-tRNA synthetase
MSENPQTLRLYNTLTRSKEVFSPIDPGNVRMYVCGPTVYDYAHIGNARPAIVFDVLYRLLRHVYGPEHVTYVRNITDVDDKINARALRDYGADIAAGRLGLNEAIRRVTEPTYGQYQKDVTALGCLPPDEQPRATEFVLPRADGRADMVTLVQCLLDNHKAYAAKGDSGWEILFDVNSMPDYGRLSRRNLDEQQAGARVAVDAHKKNPADFVLWKESSADEPGWDGTFRIGGKPLAIHGRPGWHIECSAMSDALLWDAVKDRLSPEGRKHPHMFDIHGGGLDLIFPHHENEIAQSRCAHGTAVMANYWMHNGFLQVEGRKMSKSEGNFVTIHELLETKRFGNARWHGKALRLAMLMTHYRQPIDFTADRLFEARNLLYDWNVEAHAAPAQPVSAELIDALADDLSTTAAVSVLHTLSRDLKRGQHAPEYVKAAGRLRSALDFLGLYEDAPSTELLQVDVDDGKMEARIRPIVAERLAFIRQKNWKEADRIRDELLAQGIQLKDGKDPATGERITTWEVKR